MKQLRCSRIASFLSAFTYAFSGFLVGHMVHVQMVYSACYVPLLFFFLIKALNENPVHFIFMGITLAVMFLAGHPQPTIYYCYITLIFCIYHCYLSYKKKASFRVLIKPFLFILVVFLIAFGLAAIQLFPFFEFIPHSLRSSTTYDEMFALGSISPAHLITLICPDFFGGRKIAYWGLDFTRIWIHEVNLYAGIHVFLLLALLILILPSIREKPKYLLFFLITGLISLFLIMGSHTVLSAWFYQIPGLNKMRLACRIGSVLNFSLAILVGYGFDFLLKQPLEIKSALIKNKRYFIGLPLIIIGWITIFMINLNKLDESSMAYKMLLNAYYDVIRFTIFLFFFILIIVLYLFFWERKTLRNIIITAFLLLATIDVFSYQMNFYPRSAFNREFPKDIDKEQFLSPRELNNIKIPDIIRQDKDIFRIRMTDLYDTGRFAQINKIYSLGYGGAVAVARLSNFRKLFENPKPPFNIINPNSNLLDFYNVKYFYSDHDLKRFSHKYKRLAGYPGWFINTNTFPRAFCVNKYLVESDEEEALRKMLEYNLSEYVILLEEPRLKHKVQSNQDSFCTIVKYLQSQVEIEANMANPGFVVLSDIWYPGWKAYLDDKPVKLYRANYTFRAIEVPKGLHKVRFSYEPISFRLGSWLSLVTILALILATILIKRKNEK